MNTIFRKVSADERTPNKTGLYHTNKGLINYFHGLKKFERDPHIDYWLEEIELPTDEEIENHPEIELSENQCQDPYWIQAQQHRIDGMKLLRDFVLAVTPINTKSNGA